MLMKEPQSLPGCGYYDPLDYDEENDASSDLETDDFSEYLWMENEEEFDKMEMQRLEEEEIMKECMEAMFEDELEAKLVQHHEELNREYVHQLNELTKFSVENSTLNPLAAEFVPAVVTAGSN